MKAFKFIVSDDRWIPLPSHPGVSVKGCVAVAIEETEQAARERLVRYANENGLSPAWLEVARVVEIPIGPAVLTWVEVG